jgi:tetratricopeptide (TPR) repeat protein
MNSDNRYVSLILGNSYYRLGQMESAVKQYRMLVDSIDHSQRWLRSHVLRNLGCALVELRDFKSALSSFQQDSSTESCFNGLLCTMYCGDGEQSKVEFERLVNSTRDSEGLRLLKTASSLMLRMGLATLDWLRSSIGSLNTSLINLFAIESVLAHIKDGSSLSTSIDELLRGLRSSPEFAANVAFIRWHTEKGTRPLTIHNRFEEAELVNRGVASTGSSVDEKLDLYGEARRLSADCWQARFNEALLLPPTQGLDLLETVDNAHAIFQRAHLLEKHLGRPKDALSLYLRLVSTDMYRNDAELLERIGNIYDIYLGNKEKAFAYYNDSNMVHPNRDSVINWLTVNKIGN